jgi:hypothetical protein
LPTTGYRCQLNRSKKCPSVAYLCTETNNIIRITNSHNHLPSILRQKALAVEREYIHAAATVGKTSTIDVVARIRTTLQRSDDAAANSLMRKTKVITAVIKIQGGGDPRQLSREVCFYSRQRDIPASRPLFQWYSASFPTKLLPPTSGSGKSSSPWMETYEPGLPTRVMADYERAMQSTLRTFFPQAVHKVTD